MNNPDQQPDLRIADHQPESEPLRPERLAPHSIEAEEAVLGSALLYGEVMAQLAFLRAEDFFIARHQIVWRALTALYERSDHIDDLTVLHELETSDHLEEIGGAAFITRLQTNTPTYIHAETYGHLVERAAIRRRLIAAAAEIAQAAQDENSDLNEVIARAEDTVAPLFTAVRESQIEVISPEKAARETLDEIDAWYQDPADIRGWRTGIRKLDLAFGGVDNGTVTAVLAHVKQGKSELMVQFALALAEQVMQMRAAGQPGGGGMVASTEMTWRQYRLRMLAFLAQTTTTVIRSGKYDSDAYYRLIMANETIRNLPISFVNKTHPTPRDIKALVKARVREGRCSWLIIDGFHDMSAGLKTANIYEKTSAVIEGCHEIATECNIPVFGTLHVNREEKDLAKEPKLTNALGGSRLEQVLAQAVVLYRPGAFVEKGMLPRLPDGYTSPDSASLRVAASRFGPDGQLIFLRFVHTQGMYGFFEESQLDPRLAPPPKQFPVSREPQADEREDIPF